MRGKLKETLWRFTLTLLLTVGLTMPLLGMLGILSAGALALGVMLPVCAILCAASVHRWSLTAALGAFAVGLLVWMGGGGGFAVLRELGRGILLHLNGHAAVMPLLANRAAALIALFMALCCFGLTSRHSGALPGLMVTVLVLVLLWLRGEPALIAWMLPAICAAVLLAAQYAHSDLDGWRLLPWAAAIACSACLLVPQGGVTIEPMRRFADDLRSKIEDYLFFGNSVRTSFSLITEGYYSQGLTQMGGPAYPTDRAVMTVQTPKRAYLKGVSMSSYTGRMWLNTVRGKQYLWISPLHRTERNHAFDGTLPRGTLAESSLLEARQITVTLHTSATTSLFVPQRVRELTVGGDLVPYFNDSGEIFVNRDLQPDDSYTVTAPLCEGGDPGLETIVNACAAADDPNYAAIANVYTLLPEHLQSQVYGKTREAAADAQTPYQKALTVRNWLRANYRYNLEIEPQDPNMDFVYRFLMGYDKEGYCMHFASAMTVMCRILGLPARYVEGYLAEPDANGVAHVTGLQAHAWTEVYFSGFGWLVFDPTPPRHTGSGPSGDNPPPAQNETPPEQEPTPSPEPDQPDAQPTGQPTAAPDPQSPAPPPDSPDSAPDGESDSHAANPPSPWWLLAALIAAVCVRIWRTLPQNVARRAKSDMDMWLVWSQALHDALHIRKLPKRTGESPMRYLRRLSHRGLHPELLDDAGELEALVFYGRHVPDADDIALTREAYLALWKDFGAWHKLCLILLRTCTGEKRRDFRKTSF